MFDMIREWPRYVNVPFPLAKASVYIDGLCLNNILFIVIICANHVLEHICFYIYLYVSSREWIYLLH